MPAALARPNQPQQTTDTSTRGPTRTDDSPERRAIVRAGRLAAQHLQLARKIADWHGEEI